MLPRILALVIFSTVATSIFAQQHLHEASGQSKALPPGMIDGSAHPELISDSTAYRLYFIVASEAADASEKQRIRQSSVLKASGISEKDIPAVASILAQFKKQYAELIAQYNADAQSALAAGQPSSISSFVLRRDALVQSTRGDLARLLDSDTMKHLHAHVQREKAHMVVPQKEGQ